MSTTNVQSPTGEQQTGRPHEWLAPDVQSAVSHTRHSVAIAITVAHFVFYFLSLFGALTEIPGPDWLNLLVNLFFSVMNGFAIGLLFVIGHDCVHKSFAPSKIANQVLARLVFTPCAHSASQWEIVHNKNHHGKTNFRGVDYVWAPMDKAEYEAAPAWRRIIERLYRGPAGSVFYYYIEFWAKRLVLPLTPEMRREWRRLWPDSLYVLATLALTIGGILYFGKMLNPDRSLFLIFVLGWFLPYSLWNFISAFSIYLHHTHPDVHWYDDPAEWSFYNASIKGTVHTEMPTPWLYLYKNAMEHTAHHALPSVPAHKLHTAQKHLLERYGDAVTQEKFTFRTYFDIVKRCKLYNYREHYWTDFDGRRTGPALAKGL